MDKKTKKMTFWQHLLAGAAAGVSEISLMYPLDVVKTRMQAQTTTTKMSILEVVSKITKKGHVINLYKGIVSPVLLETPKRAIKFASYEFFQNRYRKYSKNGDITQFTSIVSGGSAGISESIIVTPFELIKIKLQNPSGIKNPHFNTFLNTLSYILKTNGLKGLFVGLESTVCRHFVWNASYFGIIFQISSLLEQSSFATNKAARNAIAGSLGGCLSCFLSLPFDVVKTRIQTQVSNSELKKYLWSLQSIKVICKEEGFTALYKGLTPVMCRMGPSGGFLFVAFNWISNMLQKF